MQWWQIPNRVALCSGSMEEVQILQGAVEAGCSWYPDASECDILQRFVVKR